MASLPPGEVPRPGPVHPWQPVAATWHQPPEGADAALKDPVPQHKPWTRITWIHNKEERGHTMENGARTARTRVCSKLVAAESSVQHTTQLVGPFVSTTSDLYQT